MKKTNSKEKILIFLTILIFPLITGSLINNVTAFYRDDHSYEDFFGEKIFQQIDTIEAIIDSTTIQYAVNFGLILLVGSSTHANIISDVFLNTLDDNYISNLDLSLDYTLNITYGGNVINIGGSKSDQSSFIQFGDKIHNYSILNDFISYDSFPVTLSISFNYRFHDGTYFDDSGSFSITQTFLGSRIITSIVITIVLIIVISAIAGLTFILLRKRKLNIIIGKKSVSQNTQNINSIANKVNTQHIQMTCLKCGSVIEEGDKYCNNCGEEIN